MEFLPKAFFLTFFKKQISCCHGDHLLVNFIGLRSQGWKHHLWLVSWALYLAASQRVFFKGGTQGSAFPNNSAAWVTLNREDLAPFHWWGVALTSPALKKNCLHEKTQNGNTKLLCFVNECFQGPGCERTTEMRGCQATWPLRWRKEEKSCLEHEVLAF